MSPTQKHTSKQTNKQTNKQCLLLNNPLEFTTIQPFIIPLLRLTSIPFSDRCILCVNNMVGVTLSHMRGPGKFTWPISWGTPLPKIIVALMLVIQMAISSSTRPRLPNRSTLPTMASLFKKLGKNKLLSCFTTKSQSTLGITLLATKMDKFKKSGKCLVPRSSSFSCPKLKSSSIRKRVKKIHVLALPLVPRKFKPMQ